MSDGTNATSPDSLKVRHAFVAMLFALAAASVAQHAADVFLLMRQSGPSWIFAPAVSHIMLAMLIISMSWVEWSRAAAKQVLEKVIQPLFFLLLLDVSLVALYFMLAQEVEVHKVIVNGPAGSITKTALSTPSASGEIFWSFWILVGYLLYDIAIDVIRPIKEISSWTWDGLKLWAKYALSHLAVGCVASAVSIVLVLTICALAPQSPTIASVVATDAALAAIFVLFRLIKAWEWRLAQKLTVYEPDSTFRKRGYPTWLVILWSVLIALAGVAFILYGTGCRPAETANQNSNVAMNSHNARPVVYIASPYSQGDPAINTHFQCKIFDQLMNDGHVTPIAPLWSHFQHTLFPRPYEDWLKYDLALIERYDACLRLSAEVPELGYAESESSGADREVQLFEEQGKPVFYSIPDLYGWVHSLRK